MVEICRLPLVRKRAGAHAGPTELVWLKKRARASPEQTILPPSESARAGPTGQQGRSSSELANYEKNGPALKINAQTRPIYYTTEKCTRIQNKVVSD